MTETQQLILRVHKLANKLGRSPSTLSEKVFGSGQVLANLEGGKTITLAKYERAKALLDEMERAA